MTRRMLMGSLLSACLLLAPVAGQSAPVFTSAQAECQHLLKDYGVAPDRSAEFMADCLARLAPVYTDRSATTAPAPGFEAVAAPSAPPPAMESVQNLQGVPAHEMPPPPPPEPAPAVADQPPAVTPDQPEGYQPAAPM